MTRDRPTGAERIMTDTPRIPVFTIPVGVARRSGSLSKSRLPA
jgi:hypothetical protein